MSGSYLERGLKFGVRPDFAMPRLGPDAATQELKASYFDTEDRLLQAGLRRRSGGTDAG